MTWNERVIRRVSEQGDYFYEIHEVYYEGETPATKIILWDSAPVEPMGPDLAELERNIQNIQDALKQPVLNEEDLPKEE